MNRKSEKMMWPDCSPPSERSCRDHLLHHVLVAHRAAQQPDPDVAQRDLEADIAHDGGDDRAVPQPAARDCRCRAASSMIASPSTIRPVSSTKIARSPSPSKATPSRHPRSTTCAREPLRVRRAAVQVDVAPVRRSADRRRRRSPGPRTAAAPARVVAPLAQSTAMRSPRSASAAGQRRARVREVGRRRDPRRPRAAASPSGTSHDGSATTASISRSSCSVNFSPAPENTLMPLSSNGIVRGGDHDARVVVALAREVRRRRASR